MHENDNTGQGQKWLPDAAKDQNPHMSQAFARAYEGTASRVTAPVAFAALMQLRPLGQPLDLLDVGAGTGALSVPAAHAGASVTAIDIAPGMVELLADRLKPFPRASAFLMDGQELAFPEGSFDAAFSIFGVGLFADWRSGLAEMARVLRREGTAHLATWRTLPGGGPFDVMARALATAFPVRPRPVSPDGLVQMADPARLHRLMEEAGFRRIAVKEIEAVWEGPTGPDYLRELDALHPFMGPYAALPSDERRRLDDAILSIVDELGEDGRLLLRTPVLLATGVR